MIEILEVFEAKIASFFAIWSRSLKILDFRLKSSLTASIMTSESLSSRRSAEYENLSRIRYFSSAVILYLDISLSIQPSVNFRDSESFDLSYQ